MGHFSCDGFRVGFNRPLVVGRQHKPSGQDAPPRLPKMVRKHGGSTAPKKDCVERGSFGNLVQFFEKAIAKLIDAIMLINETVEIAVMAFMGTKRDVGVQAQGRMRRR